jgi:chaperonin cofactor prefoldin
MKRIFHGKLGAGILAGLLFVIGLLIGTSTSNTSSLQMTINSQKSQISGLNSQITTLNSNLTQAHNDVNTANTKANNAVSIANQNAATKYKSRMDSLNNEASTLKQQQKSIAAQMGELQSNNINSDGVYVVGHDIKSGIWHTNGDNGAGGDSCYFATLNSTDTSNIADNNNFDGSETVNLNGIYAFEISGPCTWYKVG